LRGYVRDAELFKDHATARPAFEPAENQRDGSIMSHALIGGLHHHYIRV
jgi:hypothetical protein